MMRSNEESKRPDSPGSPKRLRLDDYFVMESDNGDSGFDRKISPERVINLRELYVPSFSEMLIACEERNKKKKNVEGQRPRNRYKYMEIGDASTRRREVLALRANYLKHFLVNKKEIAPIAAPAIPTLAE